MGIKFGTIDITKANFGTASINEAYFGSNLIFTAALPYLLFTSGDAFLLQSSNQSPSWDGTMEYSTNGRTWTTWDGTSTIMSDLVSGIYQLMLRGTNNTYVKGTTVLSSPLKIASGLIVLPAHSEPASPAVAVKGNIENLLDYQTVAGGNHPTMAANCFEYLFGYNGSTITDFANDLDISELELPATSLTNNCYYYMFAYCGTGTYATHATTKTPIMPKTFTAATNSCYGMFYGCSYLTDTTSLELPNQSNAQYAYAYMFASCSGMTVAPKITLNGTAGSYACYSMFYGCTSLTDISKISFTASSLSGSYCYASMFYGCTALTGVPTLAATTLSTGCYQSMFSNCTSLTSTNVANIFTPARTLAANCYQNMFQNCTSLATVPALPATTLQDYCYAGLFKGCTSINASSFSLPATTAKQYCYYQMFSGCTGLTKLPTISATTLANYCFSEMFYGCSGLGDSVMSSFTLRATTLQTGCYKGMFQNCTNIVATPSLSSISIFPNYACSYMFSGCSKLASVSMPSSVNVNSNACEYMFQNCTSLQAFPTITLQPTASSSYNFRYMFSGCTNLISITVSLSTANTTSLGAYACAYMFQNCSNKTGNFMIGLPFTTIGDYAYAYMFSGCSKITSAPAITATSVGSHSMEYMFSGCSSITTPPETLFATSLASYCYQYMFQNCTSLTYAPIIKATTVATYCCQYMFSGCTALAYIPTLLATTLVRYCYRNMFRNCTNAKLYNANSASRYAYRIPVSGTGTTTTSALTNMFYGTGGDVTTPSINTTYYVANLPDKKLRTPTYSYNGDYHTPNTCIIYNNNHMTVTIKGSYYWETSTDYGSGTINRSVSSNGSFTSISPTSSEMTVDYTNVYATSSGYRDSDKLNFSI